MGGSGARVAGLGGRIDQSIFGLNVDPNFPLSLNLVHDPHCLISLLLSPLLTDEAERYRNTGTLVVGVRIALALDRCTTRT